MIMDLGMYRDSLGLLDFVFFLALCFLSDLVSWQMFDVEDGKFFNFCLKVQIMSENELLFVKRTKMFIECKAKTDRHKGSIF
jgi:hypothetical protein